MLLQSCSKCTEIRSFLTTSVCLIDCTFYGTAWLRLCCTAGDKAEMPDTYMVMSQCSGGAFLGPLAFLDHRLILLQICPPAIRGTLLNPILLQKANLARQKKPKCDSDA